MRQFYRDRVLMLAAVLAMLCASTATAVHAQPAPVERPWSVDFGLGWDNGIAGKINSGAIGTLNGQTVAILPNTYERVYGTGVHIRFGAGYMLSELTEVRGMFTYQSLESDLVPLGDIGVSRLYGEYDTYKAFALDAGLRRYANAGANVKPYAEATVGLGFISEIDLGLAAPSANFAQRINFYDRTAAAAFGGNLGVLWELSPGVGVYGQVGLRWMSGMADVDELVGGGLESINNGSSRWTAPIVFGARARF